MKSYLLFAVVFAIGLVGCSTEPAQPPPPKPFVGILSAEKVGNGPRDTSSYDVVLIYEHALPEKSEIKIGFGYTPPKGERKATRDASVGVYANAKNEIIHQVSGELHLTIDPSAVKKMGGVMDGKIYVIMSKYPHGNEWVTLSHGFFELPPE